MIEAIGTAMIQASPQNILEFVVDLDRYRMADTKITAILTAADLSQADIAKVRYRGKLRGLLTPADTQDVVLKRWTRVDITGNPTSWVRSVVDFYGWFTCFPTDEGTLVTHGERFSFRAPGRWIIEPYLRNWLEREMAGEMQRMTDCLEASVRPPSNVTSTSSSPTQPPQPAPQSARSSHRYAPSSIGAHISRIRACAPPKPRIW